MELGRNFYDASFQRHICNLGVQHEEQTEKRDLLAHRNDTLFADQADVEEERRVGFG